MKLSADTIKLLDLIENCIDPEVEDDFLHQWDEFLDAKHPDEIFSAKRKKTAQFDYEFQNININDAIEDYEKMLVSEMEGVLHALTSEKSLLTVRSNYGTGIIPSLFGPKLFIMPYHTNTLPTTIPMGIDALHPLIDGGVPDIYGGLGKRVFEMGEVFAEVFSHYPKIRKYVTLYHPDTQGPVDICELLLGSEMFYLIYDDPDGFKGLLDVISQTYIRFLEKWFSYYPQNPNRALHWSHVVFRGNIALRDDSAMNFSPEAYDEFIKPFDAALLKHFKGGMVHFCGRGDHYIESLCKVPELFGVNLSQPHLNDMEKIYRNTVDRGVRLLGFSAERAAEDCGREGAFHHRLSV